MSLQNSQNNKNYIKEIINKSGININDYFNKIKQDIKRLVSSFPIVKFQLRIKTIYSKPMAMNEKIERYYNSGFIKLNTQNEFNEVYNSIMEKYKAWEQEHQGKESGLIFNEIENTEVRVVRVKSINGSSYFDLGIKFNSLLNIQNKDDKCFAYSVIAGILYKLKENPNEYLEYSDTFLKMKSNPRRASNYKPFLDWLDMKNIKYPVNINSIGRFEKQNKDIAINVFGIEDELLDPEKANKSLQESNLRNIYPMYRSKFKDRKYVIDLLYLTLGDKTHYCLIKNINAYLNYNHNKRYHCRNCIAASYTTENALKEHMKNCEKNAPMKYNMPIGERAKCKFDNHHFKLKLPFVGYADFEAVNIKLNYMDPDLRKQINKLRIKSKSHNVNSKVKNMIINIIMKEQEISKKESKRIYHNYICNKITDINSKRYLDKMKEKYISKYFNGLIDKIFDRWIEDGKNIEVSDYEIEKYSEQNNIKIKKLSERLKEKIKRENIKLSFKDNTINLQEQKIVSYNLQLVSQYPDIIPNKNINYEPSETAEKDFIETCLNYNNKIKWAYYTGKKKLNLSKEEKEELLKNSRSCYLCNKDLEEDKKVIEHNHLTGEIRGISCSSCNRLESRDGKQLPIFFHNGSGYDFHFITEELLKHETEYKKVKVLPKDSENYISITFGDQYFKLVFKDSMRFLQSSIDNLSKTLKDDQYNILKRELNNADLFEDLKYYDKRERSFKGVFPYDYFDSFDKLDLNKFPDKKEFYSLLYQKDISDKEYEHGKKIFDKYCDTFKDYLLLYQKLDVLILSDVFENFRELCLKHYEIDPAYCYSAPGLSWNAGLKFTGIELELLTDKDMLDMFKDGIRGGFSGVLGKRFVEANNKYIKEGEIKNPNYLWYTDANNLYGCGMSEKLPYKNFKWEEISESNNIDDYLNKCNDDIGMVFKVDLEYDDETKFKLRKFPPMPLSRKIEEEELSDYSRDFLKDNNIKLGNVEKLILDLYDKKEYIVHYDILKYYISLGIKVTKIHSIISFNHKAWLKPYIDFNTEMRTKTDNDFEKDFWKLMNNSFYGKTMENISNRCMVELTNKPEDLRRLASRDNLKDIIDFNDNFKAVLLNYKSMYFNKPIYLGMCVLDYSKLVMYKFYYDTIEKYFPNNEILYSDTDSMVINIYTEDFYSDLEKIKDYLDTSNYSKDHPLYSNKNKKVIGKFKDELGGNIMTKFIGLRSKMYCYEYLEASEIKFKCLAKGINKTTKNEFNSESYEKCLSQKKVIHKAMFNLVHKKHKIYLNELIKIGLSPFDDKRYICKDGIDTLPYGLKSLNKKKIY